MKITSQERNRVGMGNVFEWVVCFVAAYLFIGLLFLITRIYLWVNGIKEAYSKVISAHCKDKFHIIYIENENWKSLLTYVLHSIPHLPICLDVLIIHVSPRPFSVYMRTYSMLHIHEWVYYIYSATVSSFNNILIFFYVLLGWFISFLYTKGY